MERLLKIYSLCFAVPATVLAVWTTWNLRHTGLSLLLVAVAMAEAIKSTAWAVQSKKATVIFVAETVFVTTCAVLTFVTEQFGVLTGGLEQWICSSGKRSRIPQGHRCHGAPAVER